jgi:hypothetical protein
VAAIAARCLDFARSLRTSQASAFALALISTVIGASVKAGTEPAIRLTRREKTMGERYPPNSKQSASGARPLMPRA